jgi:hypothetical protein
MGSVDLDLDAQINSLELEWRSAYDACLIAQADYRSLKAGALRAGSPESAKALDLARARLKRGEAKKARILAKIKRLEDQLLGEGSDHLPPSADAFTANPDSEA